MVLWEKVSYRCSSRCITVNGIMNGINLLPFLTTLHNSRERQERDMNELFYIRAMENWLKAKADSDLVLMGGWHSLLPSLSHQVGTHAPWQMEIWLEPPLCCFFIHNRKQHFYEYLQMRSTCLSDYPCFP